MFSIKKNLFVNIWLTWVASIYFLFISGMASGEALTIAQNNTSKYVILVGSESGLTEIFAAEELQTYLERITGVCLPIVNEPGQSPYFAIGENSATENMGIVSHYEEDDNYKICSEKNNILIRGACPRGTLYAVYAFLEKLGCWWFGPDIPVLEGYHEKIPSLPVLSIDLDEIYSQPLMKYRKNDADAGGRTFSPSTWPGVIDWMAKQHSNILAVSTKGYEKNRELILKEVSKRGLLVMVGQHDVMGMFLSPEKYFKSHPEWFGLIERQRVLNAKGRPVVFETANPEAIAAFAANLIDYLRQCPEINIFQLWPPDVGFWSESPEALLLGSPTERMALFVQQVSRAVKDAGLKTKISFLAYSFYTEPPMNMDFGTESIVEFCPINQNYTKSLGEPSDTVNQKYYNQLLKWVSRFPGEVIHYSYYAKYSWRSLPVVLPVQIGEEIIHWNRIGETGTSIYCEPGNWLSVEINHLAFAKASWDATFDAKGWYDSYLDARFGKAASQMKLYYKYTTAISLSALIKESATSDIDSLFPILQDIREIMDDAQSKADIKEAKWILRKLNWQPVYLAASLKLRAAELEGKQKLANKFRSKISRMVRSHANDGTMLDRGYGWLN